MIRSTILVRLVRRFAAEKSVAGDAACAKLITSAPSRSVMRPLLTGLDEALRERSVGTITASLAQVVIDLADHDPTDMTLIALAARAGSHAAFERARAVASNGRASEADRLAMLDLLGQLKDRESVRLILDMATRDDVATSAVPRCCGSGAARVDLRTIDLPAAAFEGPIRIKMDTGRLPRGSCSSVVSRGHVRILWPSIAASYRPGM